MMPGMKVLGIDIGGSAVKGAIVDTRTGELLVERMRIATPETLTPLAMGRTLAEIARGFDWHGPIGVGFPGVVQQGRILTSANLHPKFIGAKADTAFSKATGCPVSLLNDADAAGLAEMRFGAGRGAKGTVLLLTLGTGIGSAVFCDGVLVPNTEFGHLQIRGRSAERYVSGAARKRRQLGWREWGTELGGYLRMLEALVWPELIILGGGVSTKSAKYFRYVKTRAKLRTTASGNEAGIVGAALWAAEQPATTGSRSRAG
jgi:polyphosphate glucokinase